MQNYRYTILGAGLAGLSLSAELSIRSIPHLVLDSSHIGKGASGTPAGLLNPASAQKAKFPALAPECINAFEWLFKRVSDEIDCSNVILNDHILRPALDQKLANNFSESVKSDEWPNGWVSWLNHSELISYGNISGIGGMLIKKGYAVDFRKWTEAMALFTSTKMATIIEHADYNISTTEGGYQISMDGTLIATQSIIDCTGASDKFKSHLKWHTIKGQTRSVKPDRPIVLNTAVSGYGYVVKRGDNLVLGSTYEHHFDSESPTQDKDPYLLKKASMVTDQSLNSSHISERWSGLRVSTPDRLPAIGSLEDAPNFHFIFGLGSKGLYYSAWLAKIMANNLLENIPIPKQYHVSRFRK